MKRAIEGRVWVVLFACFLCASPFVTQAEDTPLNADFISGYGLRNLENAIIIHATPENPGAGETVQFTAESPIFDMGNDSVTWSINGKLVASGAGVVQANATVDSRGDSLDVIVTVVDPVWGSASYEFTLIPLQLDILYDAPTYVPPFYRGRALPSAGGKLRLQAIARFTNNSGALVKDSSINYAWSRNGTAMGSLSGLGKSSITVNAPALYDTDTISVRATSQADGLSASASVVIPNANPIPALYEDHPLYGIMFHKMLPPTISAPQEMAVTAIPYFAPVEGLYDPALQFAWTLDSSPIQASSTKRNEITITPGDKPAALRLTVSHAVNFFMSAVGNWNFNFGNSGQGSGSNTEKNTDVFHNGNI